MKRFFRASRLLAGGRAVVERNASIFPRNRWLPCRRAARHARPAPAWRCLAHRFECALEVFIAGLLGDVLDLDALVGCRSIGGRTPRRL